ncbi:uncharacterized protein FIBRA_01853 [Fibroporia radiculosa]|uniref:Pseudouridine synthase RsuA/RluA-like domain-containing protein n=1 Tax=Fibroporia radiculosa TaxID=599839 RepID=J4H1H6_9APHY|nr:uncharacterized protein FIBRA_01853 [Fibroporia radiculosa]CCL99829.1 predicted protein [Fibroporia radiculosa]
MRTLADTTVPVQIGAAELNLKAKDDEGDKNDLNSFMDELKESLSLADEPIPIHRLDKNTTGALAFALTPTHARDLAVQFRTHVVEKTYLAVVRGGSASFSGRTGTIRGALYMSRGRVSISEVQEVDKRAVVETDWELIASSPTVPLSLVKLRPYTGFKHQLRIHMAENLKTPVLGDTLYASSKLSRKITDVVAIPDKHMFLHASQLSIYRYRPSGAQKRLRLTVGAPLPPYFTRLCGRIGIPVSNELIHGGLWLDGRKVPTAKRASANTAPDAMALTTSDSLAAEPTPPGLRESDDTTRILEQLGGQWLGPKVKLPPF